MAMSGMAERRLWPAALFFILGVEALGLVVGGLAGPASDPEWYASLTKPMLMPPGWAFPVAWTLLYGMMGLAAALVWRADAPGRLGALTVFAVQLALNLAWTPVFFGAQALGAAVILTIVLLLAVLLAMVMMGRVDRRAGWLMAPYLAWVSFALYLTVSIWRANG